MRQYAYAVVQRAQPIVWVRDRVADVSRRVSCGPVWRCGRPNPTPTFSGAPITSASYTCATTRHQSGGVTNGKTYLLIVSESPITQRCRLGRVIATTPHRQHIFKHQLSRHAIDRTQESILWASRTVEPSLLAQKPHLMLWVASHRADYNGFFLPSLKPVNRTEFNAGVCFFKHSS